ncbi:MAG TPA: ABC transporter permease [Vicinamibacterales bacterium]|jgi:predicted permease|nr:ABC transporter permease [Vicinamibacterales bacterium]
MSSKILADASFAVRVMRRSVMASATIVLCLAFSIGATATVIAWMEAMVFRPVRGVPGLDRLFSVKVTSGDDESNTSYPAYLDIRDETRAGSPLFRGLAAFGIRRYNLRVSGTASERDAEPVWGILASSNYFDVLRVKPLIGRGFLPNEDATPGNAPVAIISYALWQRRFAGDPAVLGRMLWVNGRELTIVGVAPAEFIGTISGLSFDLWMPVTMQPAFSSSAPIFEDRTVRWLSVFGRLEPDGALESTRAEAQTVGTRLAAMHLDDRDRGLTARSFDVGPTERLAPLLVLMLAINVLVLLIVCTNVANLLLLRGAGRQHELSVRLALGARPSRIVRQLMTESLLLAVAGVALGLALAAWGEGSITSVMPDSPLPVSVGSGIDLRVVIVVALVGVVTLVAFGLAPALRAVRAAGVVSLTGGTRGATSSGARLRGALVGAQFALSLAVLVTAGIFLQRLDELQRVERGFRDAPHILVATVDFEIAGIKGDPRRQQIIERIVQRLATIPGTRAASAGTFVPLGFLGYWSVETRVDGYVPKPGESMTFLTNRVTPGYFDTLGIPMLHGRAIDATDRDGSQDVAVVNEAFARRFWGDGDPEGRTIRTGDRELMVIGVAANGKYEFTAPLDDPSPPFIYLPYAQWVGSTPVLHVLADGDPLALVPAVRREVAAVEPLLSVLSPTTLERYSSVPFFPLRIGATVLSALGAAALALAALGLYAVIGYAVTQRQRETGVRMALGATPWRLVGEFLGEAGRYAGGGAIAGVVLAAIVVALLSRDLPYLVPRITASHAGSFAVALGALSAVAVVASLIPAIRAARVNPAIALRAD